MTSAARLDPRQERAPALRITVGIQGEAGSFSDAAVSRLPGLAADAVGFDDFGSVLAALDAGTVDRALLPVHNTLAGVVAPALRAIAAYDLRVEAELDVPVRLALLAMPGASLADITTAASHPVALAQCARFLAHHPGIQPVAVHDTAGAARLVSHGADRSRAAIASREAGEMHGLVALESDIQDRADNCTRFWLLARRRLAPQSAAGVLAHLDRHLTQEAGIAALRGATTVPADTPEALGDAVRELLAALLERNDLGTEAVVSAVFSVTPDLTSGFPALAAREAGWSSVPLLCAAEIAVPGSLPRCIRVLLHVRSRAGRLPAHVYLREARTLRPDLEADGTGRHPPAD
ncbi:MAG: chorismate mutase [Gemmatimonadota bacterium]